MIIIKLDFFFLGMKLEIFMKKRKRKKGLIIFIIWSDRAGIWLLESLWNERVFGESYGWKGFIKGLKCLVVNRVGPFVVSW